MAQRPNILFITADQQRADCYGFAGRGVRTPHLDHLKTSGTYLPNCITPNPVCQPSRASILTGLLPLTHGVHDNGIDLDPAVGARGFSGQLSQAGYYTALLGKAHFATAHTFAPTGTPECRGSMQNYGPDWFGPYMGFQHVELMVEGHNNTAPMAPPSGQHYERWYYADGRGEEKNRLHDLHLPPDTGAAQTWHSALPVAWHNSTWVGDRTIDHLRQHKDGPFCIWASFPDPHHPFDCPDPWSRMHDPAAIELPEHRTLDLDRRPWWHRASLEGVPAMANAELRALRQNYSRIPPQTDEQLRAMTANYFGMIALIDHNVGRILTELDTLGLSGNTIVVYTSDHGDWLGDHGLILKGPMPYDGLLRVGCIIAGPGVPKGKVVDDPVSTLDLPATFLDYAGVSSATPMHSRSLRGLIDGSGEAREFAYNEWDLHASRCGVALRLRTVRTRTHRMTVELNSGAGELYDLVRDPQEMDNLYDDPASAGVRRSLEEMIASRPHDVMTPLPEPVGMA